MKNVGCFLILVTLIVFFMIWLFLSEEDNTPTQTLPSDTTIVDSTIVDSTAKQVEQSAEETARVDDFRRIVTPREINREAKELDWFKTPEDQGLKVGDFIIVRGHPIGYIGAVEEPHGDKLFPNFKLTYGKPCHQFSMEHWIYPAQGEICNVDVSSEVDFTKIIDVRLYNSARQNYLANQERSQWLKNRHLSIIVKIESLDYVLYNEEIGNLWSIDARYIPVDMLNYLKH